MDTTAFYAAVGAASFTLLGLWWTALSFAQGGWREDPRRRRLVLHVALGFLLLGSMALVSLLSGETDDGLIWRAAFVVIGGIGLRESLGWLREQPPLSGWARWLPPAGGVLWSLTIAVAFVPQREGNVDPRQLEGLVVTSNLARGLCVVWCVLSGWSAAQTSSE